MARVPNFVGSSGPWGNALSNLGTALFGDPDEALRIQQANQEAEYRTQQISSMRLQNTLAEEAAQRNRDLWKRLGGAGTATTPTATPAAATPAALPTPAAPTPGATMATNLFPTEPPPAKIDVSAPTPIPQGARVEPAALSTPAGATPTGGGPQGFYDALGLHESGGRWDARPIDPKTGQPLSSAYGKYQITTGTGADLGMPPDQSQWTPEVQQAGVEKLTTQDLAQLRHILGREPSAADIYAMHQFGAGAGPKVVTAPGNTPLISLIGIKAMDANRYPHNMTVADWYQGTAGSDMGFAQPFAGRQNASLAAPFIEPPPTETAATPPAASGDGIAPAAATALATPTQPVAGDALDQFLATLTPSERMAVSLAADPSKELTDILETHAKMEAERGTGPFAGTSIDQQMYRVVYDYETKKAQGIATTPQEDYAYKLAKYHIEKVQTYTDPITHETFTYKPADLPSMMAGQPPPAGGGQPPPQADVTQPPPGDVAAPTAQPTPDQTATPPAPAAPGEQSATGVQSAGGAMPTVPLATDRLKTIRPGTLPPMSETQAKDLNWWDRGVQGEQAIEDAIKAGANPGSMKMYAYYQAATSDSPVLQAAAYAAMTPAEQRYVDGVQLYLNAFLRKDTGAAIRDDEWKQNFASLFAMPTNGPGEIARKQQVRQHWLDGMRTGLGTASGYADLLGQNRPPPAPLDTGAAGATNAPAGTSLPGGTADDPLGIKHLLPQR